MDKFFKNWFGSFFLFLIMTLTANAMELDSNSDLGKVFSVNTDKLTEILQTLEKSKEVVVKKEGKKKRRLTFKEPAKFFDLSDKYCVLAYNGSYNSGDDSIVGFLLIKSGGNIIIPPNVPYLIWKGEADLVAFTTIDENVLSKYFRDMGIKDVYPIYSQMKIREKIDSKADKGHTHSAADIVDGVISEKFIDESITRDSELKEALAKKADVSMILTAVKAEKPNLPSMDKNTISLMQARINELEKKIARLQYILNGVTRKNNGIYLNNVNLHVVNGTGKTESSNTTGNIIVGYNENGTITGSHNIIVGNGNRSSSYGNIVSGKNNGTSGAYGVAIGGNNNSATGAFGSVIGGKNNQASGKFSTVAGGEKNNAKGDFTIIAGGKNRSVLNENPHFTQ